MRLFVAIRLEDVCRDTLCTAIAGLRRHARQGHFTRRDNLHLTLAFLGETTRLDAAGEAVGSIQAEPFSIELVGLGRFRRNGGDLWWMGVAENNALTALQQQLQAALARAGFSLEKRTFRPHLTLGREVILDPGFEPGALECTLSPARMQVREIALMESRRTNDILQYTPRFVHPLISI